MGENGYTYCEEQLRAAKHAAENTVTSADAYVPPVGTTPYYIAARGRINDLLAAIWRYINEPEAKLTDSAIKAMRLWSVELSNQIDIIDTLNIYNK